MTTSPGPAKHPRRYVFAGADRSALPFGASVAQAGSVLLGAGGAVLVLRAVQPPVGPLLAVVVALVGGLGALQRRGRCLASWLALWLGASARSRVLQSRSREALVGHRRALPGAIERIEVVRGPVGASRCGLVLDRRNRWASVLVGLSGPAIDAEDSEGRDRSAERWADGLARAARGASLPVRLSLVHAVEPDDAVPAQMELAEVGARGSGPALQAASARYRALVEALARCSARRTVVLALSVPIRALERRSGSRDPDRWVGLLEEEVRALAGALEPDHGVAPVPPLCAEWWLRRAVDPFVPAEAIDRFPLRWPWPLEVDEHWDCLRMDQVWCAVYWLASWPRQAVDAGFLLPLLRPADPARALSIVMEPVGDDAAAAAAERRRTVLLADEELRRRGGFVLTARRRQAVADLARREEALAVGHLEFRVSAYLRVSARGREELASACRRVEQLAVGARVELRRCVGQQAEAFGWSLGVGRGLR